MSQPFVGEIRCFGFQFAPFDWAFCNGQAVPIANFNALYAVIGTIYGGDGNTTFNLPNLQGQVPMHWGNPTSGFNTTIGQVQGTINITLTTAQTPSHTHNITAQEEAPGGVVERTPTPNANAWLAESGPNGIWNWTPTISPSFSPSAISTVGGSQPHDNMQPYLALNFCISLNGIFPSRN